MTTPEQLRKAYDKLQVASDLRALTSATVGRKNPDGSVSINVPGRADYVHITLGISTGSDSHIARNDAGAPRRFGYPIKVRLEEGVYVVKGADPYRAYTFGGGTDGLQPVPKHDHMIGSGREYMVEMLRIEAGMIRWDYVAGGLNVWVNPFRYTTGGVYQTFTGGSIDLTANQPATAGEWAWVLVGVDPATNTLVAVTGASVPLTTPLVLEGLDAIAFDAYYAIGAVRVRADATQLNGILDYVDAKAWLSLPEPLDDYFYLPGRSGGQIGYGGTDANDKLLLHSTAHATKGTIALEPNPDFLESGPKVAIGASSVPDEFVNLYLFGVNSSWMKISSGAGSAQLELKADGLDFARVMFQQQGGNHWEIGMPSDDSGNLVFGGLAMSPAFFTLTPAGLLGLGESVPTARLEIKPSLTTVNGLNINMPAATTAYAFEVFANGISRMRYVASANDNSLQLRNFDNGAGAGARIVLEKNNNASTPAPGAVVIRAVNNVYSAIYPDDSAVWRTTTAAPTNSNYATGTVVGSQSSLLATKDILGEGVSPAEALATVLSTPIKRFRYKNGAYNNSVFHGIVADYSPEFAMDEGRSFNAVSAFGHTVQAIKELHRIIQAQQETLIDMARQIDTLTAKLNGWE